jgi:hypothetical protein
MNRRRPLFFGAFLALLAVTPVATAAPKEDKAAALKINQKAVEKDLASTEPATFETALVNVRLAGKEGGKGFVGAIAQRLKAGLSKSLAQKALDTLGDLEDPGAAEVGEIYLQHRDPEVRLSAVRALGGAKTASAIKALRTALGDPDAHVRSLAATVLGNLKAQEALPDLVLALDKGMPAAASSIGQLCEPKSCDALLERLKSKPFDVIASGLGAVLGRANVPDDYKRKVIGAVRELASQKAREFLVEVRQAWPANGSKSIAIELDMAIKNLEGASR